jgi:hypothetical protein
MAKSTANKAVKVEGTSIDALVKEGKALGKIWATVNSLKATTKASGFDTRLGKLMSVLKAQSTVDSGQIPTHVLRTHGIANIDRRRRSEALWFYENQAECLEFIKASKKGFTSLTALQAAMRKAAKAAAAEVTQQPTKVEVSTAGSSKVGQMDGKDTLVSDTGWVEPKAKQSGSATEQRSVTVQITRTKMVDTIVKQCELNSLDLETIISDLQSQLAKQQRQA